MIAPGLIPKAGTDEAAAHDRARRSWIESEQLLLRQVRESAIEVAKAQEFKVFLGFLLADYCSAVMPSFACAYRRAAMVARHKEQPVPSQNAARRIVRSILTQIEGVK